MKLKGHIVHISLGGKQTIFILTPGKMPSKR